MDPTPGRRRREPDHLAPVLTLVTDNTGPNAPPATPAEAPTDTTARRLGIAGLAVGAIGIGLAAGTAFRAQRRPDS